MCPSGLGWVSQAPKPETLHFLSVNHVRKRREVGMAWQLPQCAKQNRAENRQKVECCPHPIRAGPISSSDLPGHLAEAHILLLLSCVARVRKHFFDSEWTSLLLSRLSLLTLKEDQLG